MKYYPAIKDFLPIDIVEVSDVKVSKNIIPKCGFFRTCLKSFE